MYCRYPVRFLDAQRTPLVSVPLSRESPIEHNVHFKCHVAEVAWAYATRESDPHGRDYCLVHPRMPSFDEVLAFVFV
jgi:hypothetical protein